MHHTELRQNCGIYELSECDECPPENEQTFSIKEKRNQRQTPQKYFQRHNMKKSVFPKKGNRTSECSNVLNI